MMVQVYAGVYIMDNIFHPGVGDNNRCHFLGKSTIGKRKRVKNVRGKKEERGK